MKKKCCFIVPYFGKMPNYFNLFLKSCEYNKEFEWIFFTDDEGEYEYPNNTKRIIIKFEELKQIIMQKFDFQISLSKPYKLCDFKPAYGYIFESYIKEYDFWGHCDIDTLMGDLNKFITEDLLNKYDKLFCLGHMVIYRNTFENNRVFMSKLNGRLLYKESFSNGDITVFDETFGGTNNVDTIFSNKGKRVLREDWSLNFSIFPTKFVRTRFDANSGNFINESFKKAIYVWDEGRIYRLYMDNDKLIREEFMYMHLQCRCMNISPDINKSNVFKIVPNAFLPLEVDNININNFNKIKTWNYNLHYFQVHYKWKKKNFIKKFRG